MREGARVGDGEGRGQEAGERGKGLGQPWALRQNHQLPGPGEERQVKVQGLVTGQSRCGEKGGQHQTQGSLRGSERSRQLSLTTTWTPSGIHRGPPFQPDVQTPQGPKLWKGHLRPEGPIQRSGVRTVRAVTPRKACEGVRGWRRGSGAQLPERRRRGKGRVHA